MIVAAVLVIGAMVLGWLAPVPLARFARGSSPAALQLTWWFSLLVVVIGAAGFGAALLLLGHTHPEDGLWHGCWASYGHIHVHPGDELVGAALLVLLCFAALRVGRSLRRKLRLQRKVHRAHLSALATATLSQVDGVLWLEHEAPFAYCVPGRPGLVVASTGVASLPPTHRDAVLSHERGHLRGRHHWLVLAAEAVGEALPRIPLFRAAAHAARPLTELAADAHAARSCGPAAVRQAVLALSSADVLLARLEHLDQASGPGRSRRLLALCASTAVPMLLGGVLLLGAVALVC